MAKLSFIFAATCLLAFISPFTAGEPVVDAQMLDEFLGSLAVSGSLQHQDLLKHIQKRQAWQLYLTQEDNAQRPKKTTNFNKQVKESEERPDQESPEHPSEEQPSKGKSEQESPEHASPEQPSKEQSEEESEQESQEKNTECSGYLPYNDISHFLCYNGESWLKLLCPGGFGFNFYTCSCNIKLKTTTTTTTTTEPTTTTTTTEPTTTTTTTTTTTPKTSTTTPEPSTTPTTTGRAIRTTRLETTTTSTTPEPTTTTTTTEPTTTTTTTTTTTPKTSTTTPEPSTTPTTTRRAIRTTRLETTTTSTTPEPTTTTTTTPEPTTTTTTTEPSTRTTTTRTSAPEQTTARSKVEPTVKPNLELCNGCVILHGVGYGPLPGRCDAFLQCSFNGDIPTALNIRPCPSGNYWNQDKLICDFKENVKCVSVHNCPNHEAIDGVWDTYRFFDGETWTRKECPTGTTYNRVTCGCTDKHSGGHSSPGQENCQDKKAIPDDNTGFFQLTANGWERMPCAPGVGYNEQTCGCTDRLSFDYSNTYCPNQKSIPDDKFGFLQFDGTAWVRLPCPPTLIYNTRSCTCTYDDDGDKGHKVDDLCRPTLILNFENDDATDSSINHFWVNNTGVTFNNGKAYFNGKSRLTIPGLSNAEFGSSVYIFIKYRHSSANTEQTLVANGDCQVRQSLAVCSGKESVNFYAETEDQLTPAKVTVPADTGLWQSVVYVLNKDNLHGSLRNNTISQPAKGKLERRQRGLVIGGGGDCENFHGIIEVIRVSLCKLEL